MSDIIQKISSTLESQAQNVKEKVTVLDPQKFEGDVKLTGNSFFDSLVIAITAIIIGLPAVNWLYTIPFKDKVPTIQCFPPTNESATNESASKADIESICLYHHVLYASLFPTMVTMFGFWIVVVHYVWRNYNSSKFNLFFSLVTEMILTKNEKTGKYDDKNFIIVNRLTKIFTKGNNIYWSYLFAKSLQAVSALVAFLVTIFMFAYSFDRSAFFSIFDAYDVPTFYCQLEQFEFLNSSLSFPNTQVPCIEIASLTTVLILFFDIVLLFVVFVFSIMSMFQLHPKELKHHQAAKFSFRTGMSHHLYQSRWFDLKPIACDLDFLILLLRRTDSGRANALWEVRTLDEIDLFNNDDLLRSLLNHRQQTLQRDMKYTSTLNQDLRELSELPGEDLNWKLQRNLITAALEERRQRLPSTSDRMKIILQVPRYSLRGAVLGYSMLSAGKKRAVYITFESTSLGIPLALTRVFRDMVYVLRFNRFEKDSAKVDAKDDAKVDDAKDDTKDDTKDDAKGDAKDDTEVSIKDDTKVNAGAKIDANIIEWPHNITQLTFPQAALSSDIETLPSFNDVIKRVKDIDFIVLGPIEQETSRMMTLSMLIEEIHKTLSRRGCLLLVITPEKPYGTKIFHFKLSDERRYNVKLEPKDGNNFPRPPKFAGSPGTTMREGLESQRLVEASSGGDEESGLSDDRQNENKLYTLDEWFIFDLYRMDDYY